MLLNIHAVENKNYKLLFGRFYSVFIIHESCSFVKRNGLSVISHL
jgi:hypothetical protein